MCQDLKVGAAHVCVDDQLVDDLSRAGLQEPSHARLNCWDYLGQSNNVGVKVSLDLGERCLILSAPPTSLS